MIGAENLFRLERNVTDLDDDTPLDAGQGEFFTHLDRAFRNLGEECVLAKLGVHRTTLLRWRTGETRIPVATRTLVAVLAGAEPAGLDERWRGFRFEDGMIVTPQGHRYILVGAEPAGLNARWRGYRFEDDMIVTPQGHHYTPEVLTSLHGLIEGLNRKVARLEAQLTEKVATSSSTANRL